jgi:peroxiredoxin
MAARRNAGAATIREAKMLKKLVLGLALAGLCTVPALATLKVGDKAPDFTAKAALGGKDFTFSLSKALAKGPVVLYFYPKAFTKGCSIEAHDFATAMDKYKALGASVIGVSHDDMATLNQFSVKLCANKFPVAADMNGTVIKAYDATLSPKTGLMASRTSYVVAPDGKIFYVFTDMSHPEMHVQHTQQALASWKAK